MSRLYTLAACTLLGVRVASAQTAPATTPASNAFVGPWQFEVTPRSNLHMPSTRGVMTLASRGDSVEARVEWSSGSDGIASPTRLMYGRARGDSLIFVTQPEGSAAAGGVMADVRPIITWSLVPRGGTMTGAIVVEVPGVSLPLDPMPLRASRANRD